MFYFLSRGKSNSYKKTPHGTHNRGHRRVGFIPDLKLMRLRYRLRYIPYFNKYAICICGAIVAADDEPLYTPILWFMVFIEYIVHLACPVVI